jgi:hypothetical protein
VRLFEYESRRVLARAGIPLSEHGFATTAEEARQVAKRVFSPEPEEVRFAKKVLEAIPDGRGVHIIDGKMQDDATWKQCKVMVSLAEMLAAKDPELAEAYGLSGESSPENGAAADPSRTAGSAAR